MKRWELDRGEGYEAYATMQPHDEGEYVTWDDYAALLARNAALRARLCETEQALAMLLHAVEFMGVREMLPNAFDIAKGTLDRSREQALAQSSEAQ